MDNDPGPLPSILSGMKKVRMQDCTVRTLKDRKSIISVSEPVVLENHPTLPPPQSVIVQKSPSPLPSQPLIMQKSSSPLPLEPIIMHDFSSLPSGYSDDDSEKYSCAEADRYPSTDVKVVERRDEDNACEMKETIDSENASAYSKRYRRKMYNLLLASIDTQISANTNDLIDEYLSHVNDVNDSSREEADSDRSISSDDSDNNDKELCVYIDNYIDDAYNGAMTYLKPNQNDGRKMNRPARVNTSSRTLRSTENYKTFDENDGTKTFSMSKSQYSRDSRAKSYESE